MILANIFCLNIDISIYNRYKNIYNINIYTKDQNEVSKKVYKCEKQLK